MLRQSQTLSFVDGSGSIAALCALASLSVTTIYVALPKNLTGMVELSATQLEGLMDRLPNPFQIVRNAELCIRTDLIRLRAELI